MVTSESTIDQAARAEFRRRGYCVLPGFLDAEELQMLRQTASLLSAEELSDDGGGRLHDIGRGSRRRFLRLRHEDVPALADFVLGDKMGCHSVALTGGASFLFVEQFVIKGPGAESSFGWHQDSGYVGFEHPPYVTFWIALDDTSTANGCIHVLPQDLDRHRSVESHVWDTENKELVGYRGSSDGLAIEVNAGSAVAFSSLTLHRSGPNLTSAPRRGYVCQYSPSPILDPDSGRPKHFAKRLA